SRPYVLLYHAAGGAASRPDFAAIHLDSGIEQLRRKRGLDRERLLDAEIGLDQIIVLLHPIAVDPTQALRRRELVGHQLLDAPPLHELLLAVETANLVQQHLQARLEIGDACGIGLLRDAYEILGKLRVPLEKRAVDDDRIAVGIEPDLLPVERAEIAAEFPELDVMRIVEVADDVDRMTLQRSGFRVRPDIDKGH